MPAGSRRHRRRIGLGRHTGARPFRTLARARLLEPPALHLRAADGAVQLHQDRRASCAGRLAPPSAVLQASFAAVQLSVLLQCERDLVRISTSSRQIRLLDVQVAESSSSGGANSPENVRQARFRLGLVLRSHGQSEQLIVPAEGPQASITSPRDESMLGWGMSMVVVNA